jgi:hypothetical protein
VTPRRGAAIEEYSVFDTGVNYADVLTRRREAYHAAAGVTPEAAPPTPPPVDTEDRALFADRLCRPIWRSKRTPGRSSHRTILGCAPFEASVSASAGAVTISCRGPAAAGGSARPSGSTPAAASASRIAGTPPSCKHGFRHGDFRIAGGRSACPPAADVWSFPIATVAQSERGMEETVQGIRSRHAGRSRWVARTSTSRRRSGPRGLRRHPYIGPPISSPGAINGFPQACHAGRLRRGAHRCRRWPFGS